MVDPPAAVGLHRLRAVLRDHPLLVALSRLPWAGEVALVGGCVRDALIGRPLKDLDLAVPGERLPALTARAREAGWSRVELDAERGIFRLVRKGFLEVDVAALRAPDLLGDLALRDLTVNALALPLAPGAGLVDPTGGAADVEARRLRPPEARVLDDDPLRVLRVLRLAAELDFEVDPASRAELLRVAPRLAETAGERRVVELRRLLAGPAWRRVLADPGVPALLAPALGREPARDGQAIEAVEAALEALPFAMTRRLERGALRMLLLVARPDWGAPELPLERHEARWLAAFGRGVALRGLLEQGGDRALPWLWDMGETAEGALAAVLCQPGGTEQVAGSGLVARPTPLLDGRFVTGVLGVPPGPEVRRLLDLLLVAQVRGRVHDRAGAEELLRGELQEPANS